MAMTPTKWSNSVPAFLPTIPNQHSRLQFMEPRRRKRQNGLLETSRWDSAHLGQQGAEEEHVGPDIDGDAINLPRRTIMSLILLESLAASPMLASLAASAETVEEPKECRDGAIVGESAVPGAYQQQCMSLPERAVPLRTTGDTIVMLQGTSAPASGGTVAGRTGVAVWNSSLLLTRLLDAISVEESRAYLGATLEEGSSLLRGKTVLELGCGTALGSIAAAKLGARSVIATDGNPEVIRLAQLNVERNGLSDVIAANELQWGLMDAADYYDAADVIIGSDLTYNAGSWRVLAQTMGAVLKPDGIVIYLTVGHSGFNASAELGGFLSVVESEGLELMEETDRWRLKKTVPSMQRLLDKCVGPSEKAVLEGTGGARVVVLGKKRQMKKY